MITAIRPTQRALADWRTIPAARSGVRSLRCADGGAVKRSLGTGVDAGRVAGRRSSGVPPGGCSVIGPLGRGRYGSSGGAGGYGHGQMHPVGEVGGMMPGWPTAIGSGPSVILPVSTVSTPSPSTTTPNRSMLRGAGPYCGPSALIPRRS